MTTRLVHEHINGRPLSDEEIISIVRKRTVGEPGMIAASVGILVHYLAARPALQARLRQQPGDLPDAIDEIPRLHAPLITNRRVTTGPVEIGGRPFEAGKRLTLIWFRASQDETVSGDPDAFDPEHSRTSNLLYGAGVHVCPGAPLVRRYLRLLMEALLAGTHQTAPATGLSPQRASFPGSGFASLPICLQVPATGPHPGESGPLQDSEHRR